MKKKITTAAAKAKGRKLQNWVADQIRQLFNLPETDVKSAPMGLNGTDVLLSERALAVFPYSVECKSRKDMRTLYGYMEQAKSHGKEEPLVFLKGDRKEPLVLITAREFFRLLNEQVQHKNS